jgi:hypothetical protein
MRWRTKARVFRLLSAAPFGSALHSQIQRRITHSVPRSQASLEGIIGAAKWILQSYPSEQASLNAAHFLEIGAGRDLALPLALRFLNVGKITTVDVSRLAKIDLIARTAADIGSHIGGPARSISSWRDLDGLGINYVAPARLATAGVADRSIDCFFSLVTLEHLPPEDLRMELRSARRLVKDDGCAIHLIDYSDHYANADVSISRLNFLRYCDEQWRRFNSRLQYVNRLRHSEYMRIFRETGFDILSEKAEVLAHDQQEIVNHLAPQFQQFAKNDLLAVEGRLVAIPS